jgi:hypothetical protein
VQANARAAAEALMAQTRSSAEELATRMRRETAEDIRKMLSEIEMDRSSAEDELETQRILTDTARVRAFSYGLAAESAHADMARTNENRSTIGKLGTWESGIQEDELKEAASTKVAVPRRKSSSAKNYSVKKAVAKKPAVVKAVAKKSSAKKSVAKKAA